jgi:prepilin-type N-terminal cleavage/methylation domain-containing protein/prepilin-type processing-associated H-X9-DG protein
MKRAARAFTLLELLVVIAVILILAALLLPALRRAKSAADSAVCRSNLRQLTVGLSMYVQQTGSYPIGTFVTTLQPFLAAPWPEDNYIPHNDGIWSYLGPRKSIWACPGYNRLRGAFRGYPHGPIGRGSVASYGDNDMGATDREYLGLWGSAVTEGRTNLTQVACREATVVNPSDMIALGDATLIPAGSGSPIPGCPAIGFFALNRAIVSRSCWNIAVRGLPSGDPAGEATRQRHGDRWNVSFCDGHVENLLPGNLFGVTNPLVAQRWNIDHQPHLADVGLFLPWPPP